MFDVQDSLWGSLPVAAAWRCRQRGGTDTREGTVFIVDDDPDMRCALLSLLSISGYRARAFASTQEFLVGVDDQDAGCLLLDLHLPDQNGLQLQQQLGRSACPRPIVFLTGRATIPATVLAMKAGAVDFLVKPVEERALFAAIDAALRMDAAQRSEQDVRQRAHERARQLTPREQEVMRHLMRGRLNKQIAGDLGTVEKTIRVHRGRILRKMGVRSVVQLVQLAHDTKFLESLSPELCEAGTSGARPHTNGAFSHTGDPGDR
jgi:FixJ family two-component response regulator